LQRNGFLKLSESQGWDNNDVIVFAMYQGFAYFVELRSFFCKANLQKSTKYCSVQCTLFNLNTSQAVALKGMVYILEAVKEAHAAFTLSLIPSALAALQ
jgi:hypothetical protein